MYHSKETKAYISYHVDKDRRSLTRRCCPFRGEESADYKNTRPQDHKTTRAAGLQSQ